MSIPAFAAGVLVADVQGRRTAERMAEHAESLQIQTAGKLAGWI